MAKHSKELTRDHRLSCDIFAVPRKRYERIRAQAASARKARRWRNWPIAAAFAGARNFGGVSADAEPSGDDPSA
jgi:hypothetical protein